MEQVKAYIDKNNKPPSPTDKIKEVNQLGVWMTIQRGNYKNETYIMKEKHIRKLWEEFVNDPKYLDYFKDNTTIWKEILEEVKIFIDTNNRTPTGGRGDTKEEALRQWICRVQRCYNLKTQIMQNEHIRKLWEEFVSDPKYQKYFEDNETKWKQTLERVKAYIDKNNKRPSTTDKIKDVSKLGIWLGTQHQQYKKKSSIIKNNDIRKSWEEFITNDKYSKYFEKFIKEAGIIKKPTTKKDMSKPVITPKKTPQENKAERQQRAKSELSELHKKYKTLTSQNLNKHFKENPEKWDEYHAISKENEKSFPEDEIPRNKMIKYLENIPGKKSKVIADLGCGFAEVNQHFKDNARFTFHNFDHHSSNDLVVERDIKDTELDDHDIDVAILSLAMWGSNCEEYLKEAYRILDTGGTLLISEPYKRWNKEIDEAGNPINKLVKLLEENGFTIIKKEEEKFMFIVCMKTT